MSNTSESTHEMIIQLTDSSCNNICSGSSFMSELNDREARRNMLKLNCPTYFELEHTEIDDTYPPMRRYEGSQTLIEEAAYALAALMDVKTKQRLFSVLTRKMASDQKTHEDYVPADQLPASNS